jgi:phenylpropionate dioxygenase-like ring-hydroxylating dioxygenase large terminal subunit
MPFIERAWYVACLTRQLGAAPLARTVLGTPLVLFRAPSGPAALVDRCPHRNAPLSRGRVRSGELECSYHGWRFDGTGRCLAVPGLPPGTPQGREAAARSVLERDGLVWVRGDTTPTQAEADPCPLPLRDDPESVAVRLEAVVPATLVNALENVLDVPHTGFVHRGLFRTGRERADVEVRVRRGADRIEADYRGEPRPEGLAGRLLAPGGGTVTHVDRFVLPSVAQVEYGLGGARRLVITHLLTPVDASTTRVFYVATARLDLPRPVVGLLLRALGWRILRQDVAALGLQADNLRRFGGERFASTEADVLGPHVAEMLRRAAGGGAAGAAPAGQEWTVRLRL